MSLWLSYYRIANHPVEPKFLPTASWQNNLRGLDTFLLLPAKLSSDSVIPSLLTISLVSDVQIPLKTISMSLSRAIQPQMAPISHKMSSSWPLEIPESKLKDHFFLPIISERRTIPRVRFFCIWATMFAWNRCVDMGQSIIWVISHPDLFRMFM